MMRIWPFGRGNNNKTLAHRPQQALTTRPSQSYMGPTSTLEGLGLRYLMATLKVLDLEKVPLANPANGTPARGARFLEIPINLDRQRVASMSMRKVVNVATLAAIQATAGTDAVMARQEGGQIIYQFQLAPAFWQQFTRADLEEPVGIGLAAGRRLVKFAMDGHTMVAGGTRSGKSVTVEGILFSVMSSLPPDKVKLALVDTHHTFGVRKVGMGTKKIGDFTNAAHLYCPVAYNAVDAGRTIDAVYAEWKRRKANNIQDADYLILAIDELMDEAVLGEMIGKNQYFYQDRLEKLSQLAGGAAKFNILLIVGAQDPKVSTTDARLIRNLLRRYIGHCADETASRVLTGMPNAGAQFLTEKGDFLEVSPETISNSNFNIKGRFQVAEPTMTDFDRLYRCPTPDPRPAVPLEVAETEEEAPVPVVITDPPLVFAGGSKGGNREALIDPYTLAIYFTRKEMSISQAEALFGIKRRTHEKHREFAREFVQEMNRLKEGLPPRSPYYGQKQG